MARAGIALGSNLGDRILNLRQAASKLRALAVADQPFLSGLVYRSEPCGCPDGSPDFHNTVVEFEYAGEPHELLAATRAIENGMGRVRGGLANAPRLIDLDLLYLGDRRCSDAELELPHPRMGARRFVLQPLCDIHPGLVLPGEVVSVGELLAMLPAHDAELEVVDPL